MITVNSGRYVQGMKRLAIVASLAFTVLPQVQAKVFIIGDETPASNHIAKVFSQQVEEYQGRINSNDLLYVNLSTINLSDYPEIKNEVVNKSLVFLDAEQVADEVQRSGLYLDLTGLGMMAPYLVSGVLEGEHALNAIDNDVDILRNVTDSDEQKIRITNESITHVLKRFGFANGGE